jgi:hypothetical protein
VPIALTNVRKWGSAIGTKRTLSSPSGMSAIRGKADIAIEAVMSAFDPKMG